MSGIDTKSPKNSKEFQFLQKNLRKIGIIFGRIQKNLEQMNKPAAENFELALLTKRIKKG